MTFNGLLKNATKVDEIFPWDVEEILAAQQKLLILDLRKAYEYHSGNRSLLAAQTMRQLL